jgi:hypothetical protein
MANISVNRSMEEIDNKPNFKTPKTNKSGRSIALSPSTALMLKEHYEI